jgi:ATP synthase protein I
MASGPDPAGPWDGVSTGWAVSSYLMSGVVVWGGIGFFLDWLIGTPHVFLAIGMVAGAILGTYLVYLRYGKDDEAKNPRT